MKLEQSFEVDLPLDRVWEALVDVERVAPCLPGAAVTGRNEDGTYNGTFTIKIGPTTASYAGKLEMQDVDEAAHRAKMHAQGSDRRGQGGATATIESTLTPYDRGTRVEVATDYHITGRLARFGRGGMIEDISERLLREFAGRLQSSLMGASAAPTASAAAMEAAATGRAEPPPEAAEPPAQAAERPAQAAEPPAELSAAAGAGEQPAVEQPRPIPDERATPAPNAAAAPAHREPPLGPTETGQAPPPPPPGLAPSVEPLNAGSIVGSVVLARIKRNPGPVVAIVGGLVLIRLMRRRR
jgi:carbon monoxide dehydrogenase subunit G